MVESGIELSGVLSTVSIGVGRNVLFLILLYHVDSKVRLWDKIFLHGVEALEDASFSCG